jgi:Ca-activated chloride channel family protein
MIIGAAMIWLAFSMPTKMLKILGICTVVLIIVIGLRPMLPNGEDVTFKNNVDVIFVMDGTLSMLAEDYNGNNRRIDAVIDDIQYIVDEIPGAYYSLIEFDNNSHINLRSTVDANAAATAAKTTHRVDEFYARGTTITIFKTDLTKILESSSKKDGRKNNASCRHRERYIRTC